MTYYLAKSEPAVYSIGQFEKDSRTVWDGVRNPQALRAIRAMKPGDRVFFYHSGGESQVVGLGKVISEARPDPNIPKSSCVDLEFLLQFDHPVTLSEIKKSGLFDDWALVRQSRLSTMEAPEHFVDWMQAKFPKTKI